MMFWFGCGMISAIFLLFVIWNDGQNKSPSDQIFELEWRDFVFAWIAFLLGPFSLGLILLVLFAMWRRRFDPNTPPPRCH